MERCLSGEAVKKIGNEVKLCGWVDTKRDHGGLTFIDLRDISGKIQCVGTGVMRDLTPESTVEVIGKVKKRPKNMINKDMGTGEIEVEVREYRVLGRCGELPIPIEGDGLDINEESRLKYRYIDLRRERMSRILKLRSSFARRVREYLYSEGFTEIETPLLTKSTKEGARDFIVPSRHHPGKFYALPQSPQQYKQLLMVAGFERYFQMARCIRDEDLRADRGYEHTQIDLEMSFVKRGDIMALVEDMVKTAVINVGGKLKDEDFPVIDYADALEKYGGDKFDLRTEGEKNDGILAFAWVVNFPFFRKVDKKDQVELKEGKSGWTYTHNPFSSPVDDHINRHIRGEKIGEIIADQYDLVCNGYEVGGGSIRAHDSKVLEATFRIMGYSTYEIEESIGHMLKALEYGAPPHGGIALGLDRLIMILAGETSLKETVAFPMSSSGKTSVMDAPAEVDEDLLKDLSIKTI